MKSLTMLVCTFALVFISGCAGTNLRVDQGYTYVASDSFSYEIIDQAKMTEEGMSIFKDRLELKLKQLGLGGDNPSKILEITFNNYYMRHGAARALVGIMAGADTITSTVLIKEKGSGNVVGKLQVMSKNPTATGSARVLIEQHADQIANYVKTGNKR